MQDLELIDLSLYDNIEDIDLKKENYIYIYDKPASRKKFFFKIGDMTHSNRPNDTVKHAGNFSSEEVDITVHAIFRARKALKDGNLGEEFRDHSLHKMFKAIGLRNHKAENISAREWYGGVLNNGMNTNLDLLLQACKYYINDNIDEFDLIRNKDYKSLPHQLRIVLETATLIAKYLNTSDFNKRLEILWAIKTRGGKSFMTGMLINKLNFKRVLIATYKPSVEDSWKSEFAEHVDFKNIVFLSNSSNTLDEFKLDKINSFGDKTVVAFVSYQDMHGQKSKTETIKDIHKALFATQWDMVVIDEFHHGASSKKANEVNAINPDSDYNINDHEKEVVEFAKELKTNIFLNMTGTAFEALAIERFNKDCIWQFSYLDEQEAKSAWKPSNEYPINPYGISATINLVAVDINNSLIDELLNKPEYMGRNEFSLSKMFKTQNGKFIRQNYVDGFLNYISGLNNSFVMSDETPTPQPYSTNYPMKDVDVEHTCWLFNSVSSCDAMEELLSTHPVFRDYIVINIAGKKGFSGNKTAIYTKDIIASSINKGKRTITLSAGKLTTGANMPWWYSVFNLTDGEAINVYFQFLGRPQTPHIKNFKQKEDCFVFDFNPNRLLTLYNQYANSLFYEEEPIVTTPTETDIIPEHIMSVAAKKVKKLNNFLPIISLSDNKYTKLSVSDIMTFQYDNVSAEVIGSSFGSKKILKLDNSIWGTLMYDPKAMNILEGVAMFRHFNPEKKKQFYVTNSKIKKPTEDDFEPNVDSHKKSKTPLTKAEIAYNAKKEVVIAIVLAISMRLPTYLTITVTDEHHMIHIIENKIKEDNNSFDRSVGIKFKDFKYLYNLGLFDINNINLLILKQLSIEEETIERTNDFFTMNHNYIS